MKLAVTGGGTGGHVFPALEIAKEALQKEWEVIYLGSFRGQEKTLCEKKNVPFQGFQSYPFYGVLTKRGVNARLSFIKATINAQLFLRHYKQDVLFSTGGYSSAPVVSAAKRLGIPYVLHEQNTVPGRTNVILSKRSYCIASVFESTSSHFKNAKVVRTGMPVRSELLQHVGCGGNHSTPSVKRVLVTGGSQGAEALNYVVLETAEKLKKEPVQWMHMTGPSHFQNILMASEKLSLGTSYKAVPFLESQLLANELLTCSLSICRSGSGTISELAAFRKPAIFVPYPFAYAEHQLHNANEIKKLGAGSVIEQKDLLADRLIDELCCWLSDQERQKQAQNAFAKWDIDHSAARVICLLEEAAQSGTGSRLLF